MMDSTTSFGGRLTERPYRRWLFNLPLFAVVKKEGGKRFMPRRFFRDIEIDEGLVCGFSKVSRLPINKEGEKKRKKKKEGKGEGEATLVAPFIYFTSSAHSSSKGSAGAKKEEEKEKEGYPVMARCPFNSDSGWSGALQTSAGEKKGG